MVLILQGVQLVGQAAEALNLGKVWPGTSQKDFSAAVKKWAFPFMFLQQPDT